MLTKRRFKIEKYWPYFYQVNLAHLKTLLGSSSTIVSGIFICRQKIGVHFQTRFLNWARLESKASNVSLNYRHYMLPYISINESLYPKSICYKTLDILEVIFFCLDPFRATSDICCREPIAASSFYLLINSILRYPLPFLWMWMVLEITSARYIDEKVSWKKVKVQFLIISDSVFLPCSGRCRCIFHWCHTPFLRSQFLWAEGSCQERSWLVGKIGNTFHQLINSAVSLQFLVIRMWINHSPISVTLDQVPCVVKGKLPFNLQCHTSDSQPHFISR